MTRSSLYSLALIAAIAATPALAAEGSTGGSGGTRPAASPANNQVNAAPRQTLADADAMLAVLEKDNSKDDFKRLMRRSKAVILIPSLVKGGFIFGAQGGSGVIVARRGDSWGTPGFIGVGGASVGLQAGAQVSSIVLVVLTDKGLESFLKPTFKFGADGGLAVAWLGGGMNAGKTLDGADVVAMSTAEGLYAGVSLDGTVISADDSANAEFYGAGVTLRDILIDRDVSAKGPRLDHLP